MFYVAAELVEGFIVVLFLKMREFVDENHAQEIGRGDFEHGGDADLVFAFKLATVTAADTSVRA